MVHTSVVPARNIGEIDPKGHVLSCYQVLDLRYCKPCITGQANEDSEYEQCGFHFENGKKQKCSQWRHGILKYSAFATAATNE